MGCRAAKCLRMRESRASPCELTRKKIVSRTGMCMCECAICLCSTTNTYSIHEYIQGTSRVIRNICTVTTPCSQFFLSTLGFWDRQFQFFFLQLDVRANLFPFLCISHFSLSLCNRGTRNVSFHLKEISQARRSGTRTSSQRRLAKWNKKGDKHFWHWASSRQRKTWKLLQSGLELMSENRNEWGMTKKWIRDLWRK